MEKLDNLLKKSPIVQGIASVGVGKKGSRNMSSDLVSAIIKDFEKRVPTRSQIGAFFAGLYHKGIAENEKKLQSIFPTPILFDPEKVFNFFTGLTNSTIPKNIREMSVKLLNGRTLSFAESILIGRYVFSSNNDDLVSGILASSLRVRYETDDEYHGLLIAIEETVKTHFKQAIPPGPPVIQLAEPFDGVNRSYLLTPIIAEELSRWGYRVLVMMGRSSGPKYGLTVMDLVQELTPTIIKSSQLIDDTRDIGNSSSVSYLDQKRLSKALDKWVGIRREILKRPFLATLEKFVSPFKADISLTSAFHGPYSEKMITIGERAGFKGVIVLRRGPEGTLSFSSHHATIIHTSKKEELLQNSATKTTKKKATYYRKIFEYGPKEVGIAPSRDIKIDDVSLAENVAMIKSYFDTGLMGNRFLDDKVKVTLGGLKRALDALGLFFD